MPGSIDITLASHTLTLLGERAAWWTARATLIVADTHFGKASHFRSRGLAVPEGSTDADLSLLSMLIERHAARELIVLGDLLHGDGSLDQATRHSLSRWRGRHESIDISLVRGNHDRHAGDPPGELRITCVDEPWDVSGIALRHHPAETSPMIAGHVHPAARVQDYDGSVSIACFVLDGDRLILPAFGRFTGTSIIDSEPGTRLFPAGRGRITELPFSPMPRR
jgi:DNA ligase-associated metallophosphoesterase